MAKLLNGFLVAFGFALLAYAATQAAGDPDASSQQQRGNSSPCRSS